MSMSIVFAKQRAALAGTTALLILSTVGAAHAADILIHGKVLSLLPQSKAFRILVQETGKERTIFTTEKTVFRFSNGKAAKLTDVKVGKTVEVKGQVKSSDAYTASAVSIRL